MTALWVIVLCGALSIVYAIWATSSVLSADQGTARMQEIAGAVREGAQAYLKRQYLTIAIVGVVIFVIAWLLLGQWSAIGFAIAIALYRGNRNGDSVLKGMFGPVYYLVANKFYFDEAYGWLVSRVQGTIAAIAESVDRWIIQGIGMGGMTFMTRVMGGIVQWLQTGNIRAYAFIFAMGLAAILYFVLLR